jgi:Fungal potassium channel
VWLYVLIFKSFAVYASDIYTAIALLASNEWAASFLQSSNNTIKVPFTIGKWIFTGCIIFSFLLLAYEARKARRIIRSRDISYAYTNVMANNYYSLKSYDHFCFFANINDSKKKKDEFAFFVFFTFKGTSPSCASAEALEEFLTRPDQHRMETPVVC